MRSLVPADKPAQVDPTHVGVTDYRLNYDCMKDLAAVFDANGHTGLGWTDRPSIEPQGVRRQPLARAKGFPVLQFNHVDFPPAVLRANFPHCPILHLIRNPRDQWQSVLFRQPIDPRLSIADFTAYDPSTSARGRRPEAGLSLPGSSAQLPAYRVHYMIWRLSQIYGAAMPT